jgi:hypothetical protein
MNKAPERALHKRSGSLAEVRTPPPPKEFGRVDINGDLLVVTEREVTLGSSNMPTSSLTGIRFGIYKHYVNGIRTSQSYAIWLTDGRSQLEIECARGFLVGASTIEKRYQAALQALWPAVIVPLVNRYLVALDSGRGFTIGDVTFNKSGLHRQGSLGVLEKGFYGLWNSMAGGKSVSERERDFQFLPWSDYGGHSFESGNVYIFRDKRAWVQFSLRDTWNAVCLAPLFDFLYEDGNLWKFVDR